MIFKADIFRFLSNFVFYVESKSERNNYAAKEGDREKISQQLGSICSQRKFVGTLSEALWKIGLFGRPEDIYIFADFYIGTYLSTYLMLVYTSF